MKNAELPFIKDMFNNIAPMYDFLNRLLSLKRDVKWRRKMVASLDTPHGGASFLDVACGTGDVLFEIYRQKGISSKVTGLDFSKNMLDISNDKIRKSAYGKTSLICGNALTLPFADGEFDGLTIAFGIRNIIDKKTALLEFFRCLKPGGSLAILELTAPENVFLHHLYMLYFEKVLPEIGGFFSKNIDAYSYLPQSVLKFPKNSEFAATIENSGFEKVCWEQLTLGVCTLFKARKPL
ncbi:bifunctional demethylmenaquinone methyltransferase/2-methoxy-6-polyprenyl-1,4-benzoquinol methylase UbiE [Desulforegula conservatrix]|uniref:bifunctional demethylmenaquinone methyltransferase/2-methoxy-6-polyprenyl-1,4-benzoquinol methylase UbiE n=1 Tax=Desulforegula conservatrix TaxID=153026 RepID=UPI0004011993|nr:bifunctional demethylmenaquinone methyltransferase/2-methoxy-6-polyprenyl-1,4-benzoquinol methylase UbiE [Desulforegula conservatrix]